MRNGAPAAGTAPWDREWSATDPRRRHRRAPATADRSGSRADPGRGHRIGARQDVDVPPFSPPWSSPPRNRCRLGSRPRPPRRRAARPARTACARRTAQSGQEPVDVSAVLSWPEHRSLAQRLACRQGVVGVDGRPSPVVADGVEPAGDGVEVGGVQEVRIPTGSGLAGMPMLRVTGGSSAIICVAARARTTATARR